LIAASQATPWAPVGKNAPGLRTRKTSDGRTQYAAYYTDEHGRQRQRTLKARTLTEAKAAQRRLLADHDEGKVVAPTRITVNAVADELLASMRERVEKGDMAERSVETIESRLRVVREKAGSRAVQKITPDAIVALRLDARAFGALRRVLSFAVRRDYIAVNPFSKLEKGERPKVVSNEVRVLDTDELKALIEATPDGTPRTLVVTVSGTGLRQSEALGLRWRDVDFDAGVIRVGSQLSRKGTLVGLKTGASRREVVLTDDLATVLKGHRTRMLSQGRHGPEAFVFSTRTGTAVSQANAGRMMRRAAKKVGLSGVGFHTLRHGYASVLIVELGLDPVRVQRLLGHARPSITLDRYSHLFDRARHADDLRERLNASSLAGSVTRSR